ncbi:MULTISPECIES: hypothetical protein [unclassified Alsobacter]|jgi:hypothetical protein|uniref:Uncharacterized protein n=1 Tax=Alsobacter sp. KACC 23698 TaxID=3149229 RepID=A0AAU7JG19_9HYPH
MKPTLSALAAAAALTLAGFGMGAPSANAAPAAPNAVAQSAPGGMLSDVRWVCGAYGRNCVWRGPGRPGPRFVGPAPYRRCVTRVTRGPYGVRRVRTCG